ncbi:MAG: pyridoxal-phosphate dependent enzyme [Rhodothermales bacterium]|nr:pyridoxal-phosphate dependent enzyme [Rhodothermales bacterium]
MEITREAIEAAAGRIRPYIWETLIEPSPALGRATGLDVFLKMECLQITRSFKVRGALNALIQLPPEVPVITASTGNHGLAVAYGLATLGRQGTIVLPETVSPQKRAALDAMGARIALYGTDSVETERFAREESRRTGAAYVSPYNDAAVVCGQGTIGIELLGRLGRVDYVFVPVGGGGLIGGVAAYLKAVRPETRVIGCLPAYSPVMMASVEAGRILDLPTQPTLSDGTAGGIEAEAITFGLCQRFVDDWVAVDELAIASAMKGLFEEHRVVVEGAAGVGVAGMLAYAEARRVPAGGRAAVILCGGNIGASSFLEIVRRTM